MRVLYIVLLCLCISGNISLAQSKKQKSPVSYNKASKENNKFLEKQWWLGVKGGVNLSKVNVKKEYTVISPTNYDQAESKKKYENFKQLGSQIGFEITFSFKGMAVSLQPTYQHSRFIYTNKYAWTDTLNNHLELNYEQAQNVDHLIIPLIFKYEFNVNKVRPYVQLGGYSAILLNANKSLTVSGVDNVSGGQNNFKDETIIIGAKDLFAKNHLGLVGGVGAYYNLGNVRLNFDIQYKYGLSNITSVKNRYSSDRLAGVGDAMDDLTLKNLSFSLGCLFPLRYLESAFKSMDHK